MDQQAQVDLLEALLSLHEQKSPFLDEHWTTMDPQRYRCPERFAREQSQIHRHLPQVAAHSASLPGAGTFSTLQLAGVPLLLTRDEEGVVRAFQNVCRHRGAELVADPAGCSQRFRCPYHAWTYDNRGQLLAVPHEKSGFPGLDRSAHGLHQVACAEFAGWIWVSLASDARVLDVEAHLGGLAGDLLALSAGEHVLFERTTLEISANWKLLVEGGLESYHFRVAHRDTIAPLFLDNLSSYQCFGPHLRSVLPRSTLADLRQQPRSAWSLMDHANVLYSLFPGSQFLVQGDHFVWIQGTPLAPDRTRLTLSTLIPQRENTSEQQGYWARNHAFTVKTLQEDFALAEGIQRGLAWESGAPLNFGRFEGALAAFNRIVDRAIGWQE